MSSGPLFGAGGDQDPKRPSGTRIGIWLVVGGIGVYLLLSGIIGILSGGG